MIVGRRIRVNIACSSYTLLYWVLSTWKSTNIALHRLLAWNTQLHCVLCYGCPRYRNAMWCIETHTFYIHIALPVSSASVRILVVLLIWQPGSQLDTAISKTKSNPNIYQIYKLQHNPKRTSQTKHYQIHLLVTFLKPWHSIV